VPQYAVQSRRAASRKPTADAAVAALEHGDARDQVEVDAERLAWAVQLSTP
jgi:hypothetical protein